jgi:outer membrane protein TolC
MPVGDGAALLKRRPDVREAERQLAASTARIGVATGALYPTVSFGASAGTVGLAEDLVTSQTDYWRFGPLISWTFPTNGARGRVRVAERCEHGGARAGSTAWYLNALRETETNLATYVADYTRADALRAALKSASAVSWMKRIGCILADASRLSRISMQHARSPTTRAQVAAAEGQVAVDQANLFLALLALGGGWEPEPTPAQ